MDSSKRMLNPVSLGQCVSCKRAPIKHVCSGCQDNHDTNASQHLNDCAIIQSLLFINGNGDGKEPLQKKRKTSREPEDLNVVYWSELNKDVLNIILGFLSVEDAKNVSLTDKETLRKMRKTYMLNTIWKINPVVFFQDINGNGSWKRNIRRMRLVDDFNRPLDLTRVPNLTSLHLGWVFNQELELEHVTKLMSLHLGRHFNQKLNLKHVTNLTTLHLAWEFNQELHLEHVPNLMSLHLGIDFNQPLNLTRVPKLTSLNLGGRFNQRLDLTRVSNLTYLNLGVDFNQELNLTRVPKLTSLNLGGRFNQPLNLTRVSNLTFLHIGYAFNQPMRLEHVPKLTSLHLGYDFDRPIRVRNGVVVTYTNGNQRALVTFY